MELRLQEQSIYLVVLLMSTSSTTKAANVVDVGGKSLSRGTDKGMAYAKFKAHKFSYLNITSIGSDMVTKGSECGLACVNIPSCFSFNLAAFFDINTGRILCELLPSDKYNNSKKLVASQFHHHYSITSPCSSSPCQSNGMCAAQYEKNSYVCVCAKGYTGKHCRETVSECNSYNTLAGADRKVTSGLGNGLCDNALSGWYRFEGAAGTKMPTSPPGQHMCGTYAPGWLNGAHPTVAEGQVTRQVCFDYSGNTCNWFNNIGVRNCGSFYVYNLKSPTAGCAFRYCGSD